MEEKEVVYSNVAVMLSRTADLLVGIIDVNKRYVRPIRTGVFLFISVRPLLAAAAELRLQILCRRLIDTSSWKAVHIGVCIGYYYAQVNKSSDNDSSGSMVGKDWLL
jgi:hypothetical protein